MVTRVSAAPDGTLVDIGQAVAAIGHYLERLADRCHEGGWPLAMVSFGSYSQGTPRFELRPHGTSVYGTARDVETLEKLVARLLSIETTTGRRDALAELIRLAAPDQLARLEAALAEPDEPAP